MHTFHRFSGAPCAPTLERICRTPHVASAHGLTPKQSRCYVDPLATALIMSRRTHDSLVQDRTASINDRSHLCVCTAHLCQNCNDRSSGCRDDCQVVHAPCHRLLLQDLGTQTTRILFRATANHIEMCFAQSLLMAEVSRLQMSHTTAPNSVNHASRSIRVCSISASSVVV